MTRAFILLPSILLAACDSGPSVTATNASIEEVADKVEAARLDKDLLRPGRWLTKVTIDELTAPGMPAGIADKMKQNAAADPGSETCMTEADVRKPKADFFVGNKDCRYDDFNMGGGKIDAKARCTAGGGDQRVTINGTYSPDAYRMAMTNEMIRIPGTPAGGLQSLTMKMHVEGKRLGDCDAGTVGADKKSAL